MSALWNEIAPWRDRLVKKAATRRRTPKLARDGTAAERLGYGEK
jgi:hypothetical protein